MKEISMSDYVRSNLAKRTRMLAFTSAATVLATGVGVATSLPVLSVGTVLGGLYLMRKQMRKRSTWKAGVTGEELLRKRLHVLGDEYTAFFNVPTCHGDIDCVLVGPGGITAIEAKHHRGIIICEENSWRQVRRVGRKLHGGPIKNPVFQLTQNIGYLKRYLGRFDLDIPIEGIVVFTHPEVVLSVEKQLMRVIRLDELTLPEKELLGTKERETVQARIIGLAA